MKVEVDMKTGMWRLLGIPAIFFAGAATVIVLATAQRPQALASSTNSVASERSLNPLRVALLYWYPANLTANFSVGKGPSGS